MDKDKGYNAYQHQWMNGNFVDPYTEMYWDYQKWCYYTDINKHSTLREFYAGRLEAWFKVLGFKIDRENLRGTIYDRSIIRKVTDQIHQIYSPFSGMLESNEKIQAIYDKHAPSLKTARVEYENLLVALVVDVIKNEYPEGLWVDVSRALLVSNGYELYKPEFDD